MVRSLSLYVTNQTVKCNVSSARSNTQSNQQIVRLPGKQFLEPCRHAYMRLSPLLQHHEFSIANECLIRCGIQVVNEY